MAVFDTAITPVASTPSSTSDTDLNPGHSDDCSILVDVCHVDSTGATVKIRVGVKPSGGSVHWKLHGVDLPYGNPLNDLGPYILQTGDVLTVGTSVADDVTFSVTGVETT